MGFCWALIAGRFASAGTTAWPWRSARRVSEIFCSRLVGEEVGEGGLCFLHLSEQYFTWLVEEDFVDALARLWPGFRICLLVLGSVLGCS